MELISTEPTSSSLRVLLFSLHNLIPAAWNGVIYEMMEVVRRMEGATLVAPVAAEPEARSVWASYREALRTTSGKVLAKLAVPTAAEAPTTEVSGEFDMAFYACQFPHEVREINCIPHWRERTRKACIFILETWACDTERQRAHFRQLDMFDHVFVFNTQSVPLVQRHTRTPVSYLPTAADTLLLPASRFAGARSVDYLCMGRRNNRVHNRMYEICARDDRFYLFDLWRGLKAKSWPEARRQNADMAARARHFVVWTPFRNSEATLTTRYFEGAASGAVMIGSAPDLPEFARLFSSPNPVVEMPSDPDQVEDFLEGLDANADALAATGRANRLDMLARHDWAHRWAEVLAAIGLPVSAGLEARFGELRLRRMIEERAWRPVASAMSVGAQVREPMTLVHGAA